MLGSSVNLTCYMQVIEVKLDRVNLYWLILEQDKVKEYLYPKQRHMTPRGKNSRLIHQTLKNDLSLAIDNVQLPYTDTYVCETSLLIGAKNTRSTGNGTYLLVYDNFTISMNHSDIICTVRVQAHKKVDLFWASQDHEYSNITSSVNPDLDSSYWLVSILTNETQRCRPHQNPTFTCNLRYLRQSLAERSIEVTCAGDLEISHSPQHPIFLYVSVLGNSLLILITIIIISLWLKKKRNRRVQVVVPYAKFSAHSKRKHTG
ncbi:uncharacterized protein [Dendropsophus ebraccatus]